MKFNHYTNLGGLTANTPIYGGRRKKLIHPLNPQEKTTYDKHLYIFMDISTFFSIRDGHTYINTYRHTLTFIYMRNVK